MKAITTKAIAIVVAIILHWILFDIIMDHSKDTKSGLIGCAFIILFLILGFFNHRFNPSFILRAGISVCLVFFVTYFMNQVLIIGIHHFTLLFTVICTTILEIWRTYDGKTMVKQLVTFSLVSAVLLFSLFRIFDQKWFVGDQMEHEVAAYVAKSTKMKDYEIQSFYVFTNNTPTFAVVTFSQDPENEYVFIDIGDGIDLSVVRVRSEVLR